MPYITQTHTQSDWKLFEPLINNINIVNYDSTIRIIVVVLYKIQIKLELIQ